MTSILFDITEFLGNPIRTGIQRVVREIMDNWPAGHELVPVEYSASDDALVYADLDAVRFARDYAHDPYRSVAECRAEMSRRPRGQIADLRGECVLVPELFYQQGRARFYAEMDQSVTPCAFVVYDFLPWKNPDLFHLALASPLNPYLRSIMAATKRCFISSPVRTEYFSLVARSKPIGDPAIVLGNDGLKMGRGSAEALSDHGYFLCFGALDGRKGQHIVLDGFLNSTASEAFDLVFAGRVPEVIAPHLMPLFECRNPRVRILDDPSDADLAKLVVGARAVFFISDMEGYGLPATESLYVGVPVVIHRDLPAVADLPPKGQIRLETIGRKQMIDAFERLAHGAEVEKLRLEARELDLPAWSDYGRNVFEWVTS